MKPTIIYLSIISCIFLSTCNPEKPGTETSATNTTEEKDTLLFSFSFAGCNRIDYNDRNNDSATNASKANLSALKRIFNELSREQQKPVLLFFLGDMVLAENTTEDLDNQLAAWVEQYRDSSFSKIQASGIELVAVPGNHEMLYYKNYGISGHDEWPLKGATDIWMKHMQVYMPADREAIGGADSLDNRMTFAFVRYNVGFIVMNTDTYNAPTQANPYGVEGIIPMEWIINKVQAFREDPEIDHIFVLGHKPYYIDGKPETGHEGLPEGPALWPKLKESHVVALLSAHVHDYQRMQPGNEGTYQVIAGNAGSKGAATFFGYSTIRVYKSGVLELISKGYDIGQPYYKPVPDHPFTVRDSTRLTWSANANPE